MKAKKQVESFNNIRFNSILLTCIVSVATYVLFCASQLSGRNFHGVDLNTVFFVFMFLLYAFQMYFYNYVKKIPDKYSEIISKSAVFVFAILLIVHIADRGFYVQPLLYHHKAVTFSYLVFTIVLIIMSFYYYKSKIEVPHLIKYIIALGMSAINFMTTFDPNPFTKIPAELLHFVAYTTSIYNAIHNIPFSPHNESNYGRYAILYKPLVKMLGNNFDAIILTIAITSFIFTFIMCICIIRLIKNNKLCVLTLLSLGIIATSGYQCVTHIAFPHRYFIFAFNMLLIAFYEDKYTWFYFLAGTLINAFGLLWSCDMGIINIATFLTFAFLILYKKYYGDFSIEKLLKYILKFLLLYIAIIVIIIVLPWKILDMYNLSIGGEPMTILDLIYPLGSSKFDFEDLVMPLLNSYSATYMIAFVILFNFTTLFYAGYHMIIEKVNMLFITIFTLSVYDLGCIGVAFHRITYSGMQIQYFTLIINVALMLDNKLIDKYKIVKKFFESGLVLVSTYIFLGLPANIYVKNLYSFKKEQYTKPAEYIATKIEKDTPSFGTGTELLYDYLGWDKKIYTSDFVWVDLTNTAIEWIGKEVNKLDTFFAEEESAKRIPETENFNAEFIVDINGSKYNLYRRK